MDNPAGEFILELPVPMPIWFRTSKPGVMDLRRLHLDVSTRESGNPRSPEQFENLGSIPQFYC